MTFKTGMHRPRVSISKRWSISSTSTLVTWNKNELKEIQREENKVWRFVLGGPGHVAVAALRGELGASSVICRDMKAKLGYVRSVMKRGDESLIKRVLKDMYDIGKDSLVRLIKTYMTYLGIITLRDLLEISRGGIEKKINELDERLWRSEMQQLTTLQFYREHKTSMREEHFYDNTWQSILLFRSRSNSLKLGWRNSYFGGDTHCKLCTSGEVETLFHSFIQCNFYNELRMEFGMNEKCLADILMFSGECDVNVCKKYIEAVWEKRTRRLGELRE